MTIRLRTASLAVITGFWLLDAAAWPMRARGLGAWTIAAVKLSMFLWLGSLAFRAGHRITGPLLVAGVAAITVVGFAFVGIATGQFVAHHIGPAATLANLVFAISAGLIFGALGALLAHLQGRRSGPRVPAI